MRIATDTKQDRIIHEEIEKGREEHTTVMWEEGQRLRGMKAHKSRL